MASGPRFGPFLVIMSHFMGALAYWSKPYGRALAYVGTNPQRFVPQLAEASPAGPLVNGGGAVFCYVAELY